jgi:hypothetical protein
MAKEIHRVVQEHYEGEFSWIKVEIQASAKVISQIGKAIREIMKEAEEDVTMQKRK